MTHLTIPTHEVPDEAIMELIRDGDQAALEELVERHWRSLIRYARRLEDDLDGAEDVVQEAFVRLWLNRQTWVQRGTVKSYLYRTVRNLSLQEQDKRRVRRRWRDQVSKEPVPLSPSPAAQLEAKGLQDELEHAINRLAPRRREIVVLARFHGCSYQQIAGVMGISAQTVANQMSAALRELRVVLAKHEPI